MNVKNATSGGGEEAFEAGNAQVDSEGVGQEEEEEKEQVYAILMYGLSKGMQFRVRETEGPYELWMKIEEILLS